MKTRGLHLLLVTVAAAACQGLSQQTAFMATTSADVSAGEIRIRAVQLGREFSAEIERAADSIRSLTDEPSIRRHALLWKMYAIPAAHEAVLLPDPAASIIDAIARMGETVELSTAPTSSVASPSVICAPFASNRLPPTFRRRCRSSAWYRPSCAMASPP